MSKPPRRRWTRWIAAVAILALLGLVALHSSPVEAWVLRQALARLAPDGSIRAATLDYNLLLLRGEVTGVELRSGGDPRPYFTADRIFVDAPWSVFSRPSLQHLSLSHPRLYVVVDVDGAGNFSGGGTRIEMPLPIQRLDLEGFSVEWEDDRYDAGFRANRLDLRIAADAPESLARQGEAAELRRGGASEQIRLRDGTVGWDGLAGLIRGLQIESDAVSFAADGRIDEMLADRRLDLRTSAEVQLDALRDLAPELGSLNGSVGVDATITGTAATPDVALSIASSGIRNGTIGLDDVAADLRWTGSLTIDGFRARIAGGEIAASGSLGLGAVASELRAEWRGIDADALAELLAPASEAPALATTIDGDVVLTWEELVPELGTTTATASARLRAAGATGLSGPVDVRLSEGMLQAEATVEMADRQLTSRFVASAVPQGRSPWLGDLDGEFEIRTRLADLADLVAALQSVDGLLEIDGSVRGDLSAPRVAALATVRELAHSGGVPFSGRADIRVEDGSWQLLDAELDSASARLRLDARGDLDMTSVAGSATVQLVDLASLVERLPEAVTGSSLPDVSGRGRAEVEFSGNPRDLESLAVEGSLTADDLVIDGRGPFALRGRFAPDPAGTRLRDVTLDARGSSLRVEGLVGPGARTVDLRTELLLKEPSQLLGEEAFEPVREVRGDAGIRLDRDSGELVVDLETLVLELPPRTLRAANPGRITWSPAGLQVEELMLESAGTTIEVDGSLPSTEAGGLADDLTARVSGRLEDVSDLLGIAWARAVESDESPPEVAGAFQARLHLAGSLDALELAGSAEVNDGEMAWRQLDPVENIELAAEVAGSELRLDRIGAAWRGAAMRGSGTLPLAHLPGLEGLVPAASRDAQLRLELLSLSTTMVRDLLPEVVADELGAEANATITLSAARPQLAALSGEIRFDALRFWRAELEGSQRRPTRLAIDGTTLSVTDWLWSTAGDRGPTIQLTGSLDLDPSTPFESRLDLEAVATTDISWFSGLVADVALSGDLSVDATVQGSVGEPVLGGRLDLQDVGFALRQPRLQVTGLTGAIRLEGTEITSDRIPGFANGGEVALFVNLDVADLLAPTGTVGVDGRGVAVQASGVRASTDLSLTLSTQGDQGAVLLGTITLREGGYRSNRPLTAEMIGAAGSGAATGATGPADFMDRLRYDIRVRSAEDLIVDTQYANLGLRLDLQLVGAGTRPGLLGEISLGEGGEVRLGGNTLIVDRGSIDFADARRIVPTLDIEATSRISSYDVSVNLSGDAFAPTLDARASEGLSQADAFSLLTVGRTIEEAGGAGSEILAEQAFNVVAGRVQGLVGGSGASSVRFEQAQNVSDARSLAEPDLFPRTTDLAARLTITRSFGEWFELTYSQGLTNTNDRSWIGALNLPYDLRVQGGTYDQETSGVELHHGLQFGRAANDPRSVRRAERTRVQAVQFTGELGRPRAELERVLKLRAGRRFDYLAWRGDVERLERLYRDSGFYQVRIRPRRQAVGEVDADTGRAPAYVLDYTVAPGPRTTLTVTGYELRRRDFDRMRERWYESVADDFLLPDLEADARRALVERGHVQAVIAARFLEDTSTEREIGVDIQPGRRFGRVSSTAEGADTLGRSTILEHLDSAGLEHGAWWAPEQVVNEIRALYRLRGYPDAQVEIGEPAFAPDRAMARIVIDEGVPLMLRSLGLAGNSVVTNTDLRDALDLVVDGPLTRGGIEAAVVAIESLYLELGYNDTAVAVEREALGDGVALTLRIHEGPRRILREIRIEGRNRTRPSLIEKAIGLQPGDAMVLSQLQSIRRRLMEIGALLSASLEMKELGPVHDGEASVLLVVTVVEKPMFDLRYGVQVLNDTLQDERRTRPGVSAILGHDNFLGIGARVSIMGRYRAKEPFGRFSISFPRLFGLPVRTTLVAQKGREEVDAEGALAVRRDETRLLAEQRVRIGHLTVGYSYSWERNLNQILDLPEDSPFQLPPIKIARLIPTLIWDSRDDVFAPRHGTFHSSTFEIASATFGSELAFWKYTGQQYFFAPVGPLVLATAVRFGNGVSNDPNSVILPRGELYTTGGGTTVRGYPDDSLGRTEFFGSFFPGGNTLFVFNQEVRFPIWRWLEGVAFLDAGSTFQELEELRLDRLAYSAGAGLRLVTPFLILRLDYGHRLTDIDYLEPDTGRWHFGIGHIF